MAWIRNQIVPRAANKLGQTLGVIVPAAMISITQRNIMSILDNAGHDPAQQLPANAERAFEAGIKMGVLNVELAIMRQYEPAIMKDDNERLAKLKTALEIVRELFPELELPL